MALRFRCSGCRRQDGLGTWCLCAGRENLVEMESSNTGYGGGEDRLRRSEKLGAIRGFDDIDVAEMPLSVLALSTVPAPAL